MNNKLWTAIKVPETIIEGSEFAQLDARFQTPTVLINVSDVQFKLFCSSTEDTNGKIFELTEENTLEGIFEEIQAYIADGTKSALLTKGLASQLFNTFIAPTLVDES